MKKDHTTKNRGDTSPMLQNIKDLIESTQASHTILALQLIEGGGVAHDFLAHLLALSKWYPSPDIRVQAKELFYQSASRPLIEYLHKRWCKQYNEEFNEVKISHQFEDLEVFQEIDISDLAWMSLKLRRKGGKYCLEHKTAPNHLILREIKSGTSLFLCNYELDSLPQEVSQLDDLTVLNISGNRFTVLPHEINQLKKLEKIYFARTPISSTTIRQLEKYFPKVFAEKYYYQANDLKQESAYLKAYIMYQRAAKLDPLFAESWHQAGLSLLALKRSDSATLFFEKAQQAYHKLLKHSPNNAYYWFALATLLARTTQTAAMIHSLQKAIRLNSHYKSVALEEDEFQNYDLEKLL